MNIGGVFAISHGPTPIVRAQQRFQTLEEPLIFLEEGDHHRPTFVHSSYQIEPLRELKGEGPAVDRVTRIG